MRIRRFIWIFGVSAIYAMSVPGHAENAPKKASEGIPRIQFEEMTYDFGQVREGTEVIHVYKFNNVGTDTLVIGKIRTSCGCTAALASEREIPPGEEGEIKVTFDSSSRHGRGKIHRTITVPSNDPEQPKVELSLTGEVLVEIEITPRYLNFGTIQKGEERSGSVKVRFPCDPTRQVTQVESLTKGISAEQVSSKSAEPGETEIQIRLSKDVPVGRLSGRVQISTTNPNKPTDTIMVIANVQGEIVVQPSVLSGVFRKGDPKAIVTLTKKGKKNLKIKKVEEDTGRFTTHVVQVKKGEHYRVELSLRDDAKPGRFQGTLKLYTNHPDQRVIEVRLSGVVQE